MTAVERHRWLPFGRVGQNLHRDTNRKLRAVVGKTGRDAESVIHREQRLSAVFEEIRRELLDQSGDGCTEYTEIVEPCRK